MSDNAKINWAISGDHAVEAGHQRIARSVRKIGEEETRAARAATARVRAQAGHGGIGGAGHGGFGGALHAISRGGGRGFGGHALHGLGNVLSMSGPLAAVGGAALGASVALHAMEAASERQVKAAMEEVRARQELAEHVKQAVRAADSAGVSTFKSNEDALRSIAGQEGGDNLAERAKLWAKSDGPDAIKAFALLAAKGMTGSMDAASAAAGTGQVGILEAAKALTSGKISATGTPNQVAAGILSDTTDRAVGEGDVARLRANFGGSKLGSRIQAFDFGEGGIAAAGVGRFQTSNSIFAQQREEADRINNPERAARQDVADAINQQLRQLAAGSQAEWAMVGLLKDIAMYVGAGEGSMARRYAEVAATMPGN